MTRKGISPVARAMAERIVVLEKELSEYKQAQEWIDKILIGREFTPSTDLDVGIPENMSTAVYNALTCMEERLKQAKCSHVWRVNTAGSFRCSKCLVEYCA